MSKQLLCRYYAQGICNFGELCHYSHNPENSVPIPEDVCLFYLRSYCMNGNSCSKKHLSIDELVKVKPVNNVETKENSDPISEPQCHDDASLAMSISTENNSETSNGENSTFLITTKSDANKSYASVASTSQSNKNSVTMATKELCTFFESNGVCFNNKCTNVHGKCCDYCGLYSLHPFNETQREHHIEECIREHEKNMEESFAYQRSKDLTCGICLDVIMDKESLEQRRFGILENCLHVYCLECIRTWRNSNFEKKNKRGCPQCRIKSDFVIPSQYFYDDETEKSKLINQYKDALSKQHCKYFKNGQGKCPFEGACFYKHEYPDGTKADLPMPSERRRIKGTSGRMEEYSSLLQSLFLDVENLREILTDGVFDLSDYEDIFFIDN